MVPRGAAQAADTEEKDGVEAGETVIPQNKDGRAGDVGKYHEDSWEKLQKGQEKKPEPIKAIVNNDTRPRKKSRRNARRGETLQYRHTTQIPDIGKISYSRFKRSILRRRERQIDISSSPITTRWQHCQGQQQEHTFNNPSSELSPSSSDEYWRTPEKLALLPYLTDVSNIPDSTLKPSEDNVLQSISRKSIRRCLNQKKISFLQPQIFLTSGEEHKTGTSKQHNTTMQICEKDSCTFTGCHQSKTNVSHEKSSNVSSLQREVKIHVPGLRNDYYLNLLDWNSENLVALGLKSAVYIWNSENNKLAQTIPLHSQSTYVSSVSWISTGSCLAVGTSNGEVQLWDIETQKRLRNMLGHMSVVGAISWNQHIAMNWCPWLSDTLAVGGGMSDGHIRIWDTTNGKIRNSTNTNPRVNKSHDQICSILWLPDTRELITGHGSLRNQMTVWQYPSLLKDNDVYGHGGRVLHLALSRDQKRMFSASANETSFIWKYNK